MTTRPRFAFDRRRRWVHLTYDGLVVQIDDRVLAHLQIVIVKKLRKGDGFVMSWKDSPSVGDGRSAIWLHPTIPVHFKFEGGRVPSTKPGSPKLMASADGHAVLSSPRKRAPCHPRRTRWPPGRLLLRQHAPWASRPTDGCLLRQWGGRGCAAGRRRPWSAQPVEVELGWPRAHNSLRERQRDRHEDRVRWRGSRERPSNSPRAIRMRPANTITDSPAITFAENVRVANEIPSLRTPVRFSTSSTASAIIDAWTTRKTPSVRPVRKIANMKATRLVGDEIGNDIDHGRDQGTGDPRGARRHPVQEQRRKERRKYQAHDE